MRPLRAFKTILSTEREKKGPLLSKSCLRKHRKHIQVEEPEKELKSGNEKNMKCLRIIHTVSLITAIFTVFSEITYMFLRYTASFCTRKLLRQTWSG